MRPGTLFNPALQRKFLFLLILLILLVVPVIVVPFVPTSAPSIHGKELAMRVLLAFLIIALPVCRQGLARSSGSMTEVAILAFIGSQVLAALLSGRFLYCFYETWHLWMLPAVALLILRLRPTVAELQATVLTIVAAAVAAAAYGYGAYTGYNPLQKLYPFELGTEGRNYMHSFLGNPEYFGSYMAPVAVLCVSMAFRPARSLWSTVSWAAAAFVFLLAIALSGTRGAFLAFGLAFALIAWRQGRILGPTGRRRALAATAGAILLGTAALVVLSTPNPLNRRNLQLAQRFTLLFDLGSESVRERILFYSLAARMVAENPVFGAGPGTYKLEFFPALEKLVLADPHAGVTLMAEDLHNRIAEHAHNDYLEIWADSGTLGFGALLLVLISAGWQFFRVPPGGLGGSTAKESVQIEAFRTGFFASSLCLFVNAAFSFPLHLPTRASLAWITLGCFLAADRLRAQGVGRGKTED